MGGRKQNYTFMYQPSSSHPLAHTFICTCPASECPYHILVNHPSIQLINFGSICPTPSFCCWIYLYCISHRHLPSPTMTAEVVRWVATTMTAVRSWIRVLVFSSSRSTSGSQHQHDPSLMVSWCCCYCCCCCCGLWRRLCRSQWLLCYIVGIRF